MEVFLSATTAKLICHQLDAYNKWRMNEEHEAKSLFDLDSSALARLRGVSYLSIELLGRLVIR